MVILNYFMFREISGILAKQTISGEINVPTQMKRVDFLLKMV
jgi:hypothetical protein